MTVNRVAPLLIRLIVLTVEVDAGIGGGVQRRLHGDGRELACTYGSWLKMPFVRISSSQGDSIIYSLNWFVDS